MRFEQAADRLARRDLEREYFLDLVDECEDLADFEISDTSGLRTLGLDVEDVGSDVRLLTRERSWRDQKFCVVDIETNNLPVGDARVIEIGAVMLQGRTIIDEFHSLIYTDFLPDNIINLTGITPQMLEDAPDEGEVLEKFRLFLGRALFVAHNVDFDYGFLCAAYRRHGNPPLLNRKLCTIKLARKTIESPKYGLATLRQVLGIDDGVLHRGLDDARSAVEVFRVGISRLPTWVKTSEDLIEFPRSEKRSKQLSLPLEEA
jgi:DNA polymerase-3 subunit epsilon